MSTEQQKGPLISKEDPTPEQIAEWKKKHSCEVIHAIKLIDEHDSNKVKKAFLRNPNIDDLVRANGSDRSKAGTYSKSLFENCVLQMHPDITTKPILYNGAVLKIREIELAAEAELEKL